MSEQTALTTTGPANDLAAWGDREEIAGIARRLRTMLPNGNRLSENQIFALAQYSRLTGLDPFTGAIHAMPDGGLVDGYKVLTAWAQSREPFTEKLFRLTEEERQTEGLGDDVIEAWYVYLLKRSQQPTLLMFLQTGIALRDALDLCSNRGLGVVRKSDITGRDGKTIAPPKTKSWVWVAQKRALRAAIALAYGQPTLRELAALGERLEVEGLEMSPAAGALIGMGNQGNGQPMTAAEHRQRLAANVALLRGDNAGEIGEEGARPINPGDIYQTAETAFYQRMVSEIPYYHHPTHVKNTMSKLGLVYADLTEEALKAELEAHASAQADTEAGGQPSLFVEGEIEE